MMSVARGRDFEGEVEKFLRAAGFDGTRNAKSAKPRQTDLFAKGDDFDLLIEAKDRNRNVDVGDVDALRSRLARVPSNIIGVIFTTSRLTQGAIKAIEVDRTREVLAIVTEEIEKLRAGEQNLKTLIDRKRTELRVHGKAWFGSSTHLEFVDVRLPRGAIEFRIGGEVRSYFESKSGFGGIFYSLQIPDSGWGIIGGEGARLSIQLALNSVRDLRDISGYLHQKFGLSNGGIFAIQQAESCWHGIGIENFLHTAEQWSSRYEQSQSTDFHHSEELHYFDQFINGWVELSSQQRIDFELDGTPSPSFLHNSEIVIQLPGVPVNAAPFLKLCQYAANDWANFNYIAERFTRTVRLKKRLTINVVGEIVKRERLADDDRSQSDIVVGVIAQNPFYRRKSLPKELRDFDVCPLDGLSETELFICSLRDWHDTGDTVDRYKLHGFEITVGGVGTIVRPFGSWGRILKRSLG